MQYFRGPNKDLLKKEKYDNVRDGEVAGSTAAVQLFFFFSIKKTMLEIEIEIGIETETEKENSNSCSTLKKKEERLGL